MVDQTIADLAPIIGKRAACAALGRSRATYYRRHRQSPPSTRAGAGQAGKCEQPAERCQRIDIRTRLTSGSFADSVTAYHNDFKDDFGVNMPMSVANDPLVGHLPTA